MERQFNRRHAAVERNLVGGDHVYSHHRQSQEWTAGSVTKRIDGRLYMTIAHGSTRRFHANQMQPRSKQTTDDDFTKFEYSFKLCSSPTSPQWKNRRHGQTCSGPQPTDQQPGNSNLGQNQTDIASQAKHRQNPAVLNET